MQLVLVSRATGVAQFVDVDDNPSLRSDVQTALESASVPLGVIAWTREGEGLTGSKMVLPWVEQDPVASRRSNGRPSHAIFLKDPVQVNHEDHHYRS